VKQELAEYLECISGEVADNAELLEASYREVCRFASARGQQHYLLGIRAMHSLGKGQDLVLTYVQEMPVVIREAGEDVTADVVEAVITGLLGASGYGALVAFVFLTNDVAATSPHPPLLYVNLTFVLLVVSDGRVVLDRLAF